MDMYRAVKCLAVARYQPQDDRQTTSSETAVLYAPVLLAKDSFANSCNHELAVSIARHAGAWRRCFQYPRAVCVGRATEQCFTPDWYKNLDPSSRQREDIRSQADGVFIPKMLQGSRFKEQAEVLDAIEKLQQTSICADIDTPRIVVCGDHSSDKDSLLEALTQLPFPTRSTDTQCCATELVMRYAANPRVYASIRPDPSRAIADVRQLRSFRYTSQVVSQDETARLFHKATEHLNTMPSSSGYWYDTLRIEISGPTQLPLTLIVCLPSVHLFCSVRHVLTLSKDLPALYRTKTQERTADDVAAILELAQSYLYKPRTIILAVVNAMWDSELQLIRDLINSHLALHKRTLGVITRPEGILEKADAVRMHRLARNDDAELKLGLGWHVIKKPQHGHSLQQIGSQESAFFRSGIWSTLPSADLGVGALKDKLSYILFTRIQHEMPRILTELTDRLVKAHAHDAEPHE